MRIDDPEILEDSLEVMVATGTSITDTFSAYVTRAAQMFEEALRLRPKGQARNQGCIHTHQD